MKSSAVPIISVRKKLVGAVTEAILHYISVLVETEGDIGVCKNCLESQDSGFWKKTKNWKMLEKESQRILNIKVKLYDSLQKKSWTGQNLKPSKQSMTSL